MGNIPQTDAQARLAMQIFFRKKIRRFDAMAMTASCLLLSACQDTDPDAFSRVLRRFQAEQWLAVDRREVELLDAAVLEALAAPVLRG